MKRMLIKPNAIELNDLQLLIKNSSHQTLAMWALDCAKELLTLFELEYQADDRPRIAIEKGYLWASGHIKMPEAKKAILAAHQSATEHQNNLVACAIARAIGQGVSTIHVRTHAIGIVIYGITALIRQNPSINQNEIINAKAEWFYKKLLYWQNHVSDVSTWAPFLLKEEKNKEEL